MLRRCSFPACVTFTLSTYCVARERFVRDENESERVQAAARARRLARERLAALNPDSKTHD